MVHTNAERLCLSILCICGNTPDAHAITTATSNLCVSWNAAACTTHLGTSPGSITNNPDWACSCVSSSLSCQLLTGPDPYSHDKRTEDWIHVQQTASMFLLCNHMIVNHVREPCTGGSMSRSCVCQHISVHAIQPTITWSILLTTPSDVPAAPELARGCCCVVSCRHPAALLGDVEELAALLLEEQQAAGAAAKQLVGHGCIEPHQSWQQWPFRCGLHS